MEHRVNGHKAQILATVMVQVRDIEAQLRELQQAHRELSAAIHAEAEEIVGHNLPSPMQVDIDGGEVVLIWNDAPPGPMVPEEQRAEGS